jgi:hypothetical protein
MKLGTNIMKYEATPPLGHTSLFLTISNTNTVTERTCKMEALFTNYNTAWWRCKIYISNPLKQTSHLL